MSIKFLTERERDSIGFNYIIGKLEVITPYGSEEVQNIKPFKKEEKESLIKEFNYIELIIENLDGQNELFDKVKNIFFKVKDIRHSVKRCKAGVILDEVELYEIKVFSLLSEELRIIIERLGLGIKEIELKSTQPLLDLLDPQGKRIATFQIYDEYSQKLKEIREQKREIERQIFLETRKEKIEELKQKRLDIVILEQQEELEVKKKICKEMLAYTDILESNIKAIGRFDFLIAKARLAMEYGGVKPCISEDPEINFIKMINPQVADVLKAQGKKFTPISLNIKEGVTVITGANMGGKTIALKTVTLNLLLGIMGFFVFAEEASIPIVDFIHFISEDQQSVSRGLSSFGAEIIKLKEIIEDVKAGSGFVALDEVARSTNPEEGLAIVKAILKYLNTFPTITILATHYDGVVEENMVHYQVVGLKNVDFEVLKQKISIQKESSVDILQEYMDYSLERVEAVYKVPKDALNICRILGLEEEIIKLAESYYN